LDDTVEQVERGRARIPDRDRSLVLGAVITAGLVYALSLVGSLVVGDPGAPKAAIRLALLTALGFSTVRRINWARWVLVAFLAVWALEQAHWAIRGNFAGAVASSIFVACAITLASRPASRFIERSVADGTAPGAA